MKPVNSIGIFGAVSSSTVSALNAIERGAVAVANTANVAVSMTEWANEEVDNLRHHRAIKREVEGEIFRTKYVMEAAPSNIGSMFIGLASASEGEINTWEVQIVASISVCMDCMCSHLECFLYAVFSAPDKPVNIIFCV